MKNFNLSQTVAFYNNLLMSSVVRKDIDYKQLEAKLSTVVLPSEFTTADRAALDILFGKRVFSEQAQGKLDLENFTVAFMDLFKRDREHYFDVRDKTIDEDIEKNFLFRVEVTVDNIFSPIVDLDHMLTKLSNFVDNRAARPGPDSIALDYDKKIEVMTERLNDYIMKEGDVIIERLSDILETIILDEPSLEYSVVFPGAHSIIVNNMKGILSSISSILENEDPSGTDVFQNLHFAVSSFVYTRRLIEMKILSSLANDSKLYIPLMKRLAHIAVEEEIFG